MEGIEIEEEEEQLLNLTLSLVSHTYGEVGQSKTRKKNNYDFSTSQGSSDGGEWDDQGVIFRLFQIREQMLTLENKRPCLLQPQLIHLLLKSTTSVDDHTNPSSAVADLINLYQNTSLTGNSTQRLVAYFTDGLTARLITEKSPLYGMIMKEPVPNEEFLAFTHLYRVSPCYQFSHFTANQAILEAFEREGGKELHVVDFDLAYGLQWPSLIQSLSEKAGPINTVSFRITGIAGSLEELEETEARLVSFSKGFRNVVFEFQGLLRGSKIIGLRRKGNETLAINLVSHLRTSKNDLLMISSTIRPIRSLCPSIVVLVQREGDDRSSLGFLARFMESLRYYAALFDSLDDCLPRDSLERLCIEKNHLGREIKGEMVTSCVGNESTSSERHKRMESNGFCGIELSLRTTMQARLLLRMRSHYQPQFEGDCGGGFRVLERDNGKAISLGWQDRVLVTASAWQCV